MYHLLHVLSMIITSGAQSTSVYLNIIIIFSNGMAVYMCSCILLAIACLVDYWLYGHPLQYLYIYAYYKTTDRFYVSVHV